MGKKGKLLTTWVIFFLGGGGLIRSKTFMLAVCVFGKTTFKKQNKRKLLSYMPCIIVLLMRSKRVLSFNNFKNCSSELYMAKIQKLLLPFYHGFEHVVAVIIGISLSINNISIFDVKSNRLNLSPRLIHVILTTSFL